MSRPSVVGLKDRRSVPRILKEKLHWLFYRFLWLLRRASAVASAFPLRSPMVLSFLQITLRSLERSRNRGKQFAALNQVMLHKIALTSPRNVRRAARGRLFDSAWGCLIPFVCHVLCVLECCRFNPGNMIIGNFLVTCRISLESHHYSPF